MRPSPLEDLRWTPWAPVAEAVGLAPRSPGVYEARCRGEVVYVGRAGTRNGAGVAGRLRAYATGKSPDSGLIGKAADRALQEPAFVDRLAAQLAQGRPWTLREIAVAALDHLRVEIRSAPTDDAVHVERQLIDRLPASQRWNLR